MSPVRRRAAVEHLKRKFKVSERRACRLVGQHRSTNRYQPVASDFEQQLVAAMLKVADSHPRYGYRRVHAVLVSDGWSVNVKRVERLWRVHGLGVPPPRSKKSGQRAIGGDVHALWTLPAVRPGHIWSYDFMSLKTHRGTSLRILNVVDEFTRVCIGSFVAYSIGATEVRHLLTNLFTDHGKPAMIRSDNGREFIATWLLRWLREQGVEPIHVAKGSPQQNGYVERFNGSMRDELLNREQFHSLAQARVVVADWVRHYNTERPHQGLGNRTPAAYAAYCSQHKNDENHVADERGP